jgi:hypothetical protein
VRDSGRQTKISFLLLPSSLVFQSAAVPVESYKMGAHHPSPDFSGNFKATPYKTLA